MLKKINKVFLNVLFGAFVVTYIAAYRQWLFSFSILTKGDWWFYIPQTLTTLRINYFSLWLQDLNLGRVLIDVGQAPTYALYGLLAKNFHLDYAVLERLIHMWPIIIWAPLCSYLLIKNIYPNSKFAQLVGVAVYTLNTYFLDLETGDLTLMAAFAIAPIILFYYKKFLDNYDYKYGVLTSLALFICCAYEPRVAYVLCFVLFLYAVFNFFISFHLKKSYLKLILYSSFPAVLFILLNFYWAFGLAKTHNATTTILQRSLWGDLYYNTSRAITLFHPWWTGREIAIFTVQPIPFYFWLVPIFAFLGLIFNRKNKDVIFYAIIALIGVTLTKQSAPPFTNLYQWLYDHIPGFSAYREASKFYFFIALGYSVLIAGFVDWLWQQSDKYNWPAIAKYALTTLVLFIFLWNTKPFISGEIKSLFLPREIPQDYLTYNNFIMNQSDYSRTLWVPTGSRFAVYTDIHPKINFVDILQEDFVEFNSLNRNSVLWPFRDQITYFLQHGYAEKLIENSSVKYVVVPTEDVANDDDFFIDYGGREDPNIRSYYIALLDSLPYLHRINIGTTDLVVYQNDAYKPYISSFDALLGFSSLKNLDQKYAFAQNTLATDFNFTVQDKTKTIPTVDVRNVFEDTSLSNIATTSISLQFDTQGKFNIFYPAQKNGNVSFSALGSAVTAQYTGTTTFQNIISNPSFEQVPWQATVGDCNNYDSNAKIAMGLSNEATNGTNSLELDATRHIACTSIILPITPGKEYLFTFDYQSPNSQNAGYYFDFGNNAAAITEQIPIIDKNWQTFSKIITMPRTATSSTLNIYSYATDNITQMVTRYDNFHLIQLPDVVNNYWLVSKPSLQATIPKNITYDLLSPSKKLAHITGATTPFYLSMSEAYHDQWQLEVNNAKVQGTFNSWVPWAKPDKIADTDHFKLDDFLNGWYVDPHALCTNTDGTLKQGCTQNADGSYDIEMVIEFWPQRWFYVGLIISGTTLLACLGYLGYRLVRRKKVPLKERTELYDTDI